MKEQTAMTAASPARALLKEHLLKTLENSQIYTLAVAQAMPANAWHTRPAENVWNFRELLHHIAYGITWWEDNYVKGNKSGWNPPVVKENKKEVMDYLQEVYGTLKETIQNSDITDEMLKGFFATLDHITHHRGQAVTYLRYKGIEPPEYAY